MLLSRTESVLFSTIRNFFFLKMSIFSLKSANYSRIWEENALFEKKNPNFGEKDRSFQNFRTIFCSVDNVESQGYQSVLKPFGRQFNETSLNMHCEKSLPILRKKHEILWKVQNVPEISPWFFPVCNISAEYTLTKIWRKRQKIVTNFLKMRIFLSKWVNYSSV